MVNSRRIVIVTEEMDPHADALILLLREMGHDPLRMHTADYPQQANISMLLKQDRWDGTIGTPGGVVAMNDIHSIWWRRPARYQLPQELSAEERDFAYKEWDQMLKGLWDSLDCYWMSYPPNIQLASRKPEQLIRAAQLGFEVPRTLITNDPTQVQAFYEAANGRVAYKTLSSPVFREPKGTPDGADRVFMVYTTPLDENLLSRIDTVRFAPCLFQEYIPKRLELRVTVIGDEIFAAEIDSQAQERTTYDWRHYDVPMLMRKSVLPDQITERCRALVSSYGLNFGAIDLILTPDDRYVFLEINPNGQWLFVQEQVPDLKMKEALASCLIRGKSAG